MTAFLVGVIIIELASFLWMGRTIYFDKRPSRETDENGNYV